MRAVLLLLFLSSLEVTKQNTTTKFSYKVLSASDIIFVTSVNSSTSCSMQMCHSIYSWFSHFSGGAGRETCSHEAKGHKVGFFKKMTPVIGICEQGDVELLSGFTLCTGTVTGKDVGSLSLHQIAGWIYYSYSYSLKYIHHIYHILILIYST